MNVNGQVFVLENDYLKVCVASVGAALLGAIDKRYGQFLLHINDDEFCEGYVGKCIAPWVNRIFDGVYTVGGKKYFLPINDKENNAAIHGLVAWNEFSIESYNDLKICLSAKIFPSPSYPFKAQVFVEYELCDNILKASLKIRNLSDVACPVGLCFHPYIVHPYAKKVDECSLSIFSGLDLAKNAMCEFENRGQLFFEQTNLNGVNIDNCYKLLKKQSGFWKAFFSLAENKSLNHSVQDIAHSDDVQPNGIDSGAVEPNVNNENIAVFMLSNSDYVQLYSGESVSRQGFAIEPCTTDIDVFGDSKGGEFLPPNAEKVLEFFVGIEVLNA